MSLSNSDAQQRKRPRKCRQASRTLRRAVAGCAVLAVALASPCAAQQLWPVFLEANIGVGVDNSSSAHAPSGRLSTDALIGLRLGARSGGGIVVALNGAAYALGSGVAECPADGSCTPDFPIFRIVSTLAGWETSAGSARLLVGPAVARPRGDAAFVGAAQVRMEFTTPAFRHLALLASGRFVHIPRYQGDSFSLMSAGVGVRLR